MKSNDRTAVLVSVMLNLLVLSLLMALGTYVHAQDAFADLDPLAKWLYDMFNKIPTEGVVITVLSGALEFALRKYPSIKPWGILHLVHQMLGVVYFGLGRTVEFSDKVLPQNIKQPEVK